MSYQFVKTSKPAVLGSSIRDFFGAVPGALKGHLNTIELSRITLAALTAGGGILGLLEAILLGAGTIFPAPADAALAALVVTLILESLRRLSHGQEPGSNGAVRIAGPQGNHGSRHRV
jgi:hypothetical protein